MNEWADLRGVFKKDSKRPGPFELRICYLGGCPEDARSRGYE